MLNRIDPRFGDNIDRHIRRVLAEDVFHVSANTDPKGDRSKRPQDQDPDKTDAGIVLRGAKYETAASYADQAFLKPTVGAWTDEELSDYAVGCIVRMGAPGVKHLCRSGFAGCGDPANYPLASRFDEVDTLVVLDNVLIPGRTCSSTATPAPPRSSAARCTAIRPSPRCCASSTPPT